MKGARVSGFSEDETLQRYLALLAQEPDLFQNTAEGGIDILQQAGQIALARDAAREKRAEAGWEVCDLRPGILARDPYMTVLRDAVRFPDGELGLYNRVVEPPCVAVLPLLQSKVVLVRIFRHGLRDWSLEFPRGGCEIGESPVSTARRELFEEIGANALELLPLGSFSPGGSSLSIRAELYLAHIDGIGEPDRGDGIADIVTMGVADVEERIGSSRIIDGFTMALFLRARLAGHL